MVIIFDGKDVVSINMKRHIVRDINGQCDKLPHLYMPTNWRHIPKGKTYNDIIFSYRYCAQYESMLCHCIDNDMKTIRGKVRISEIPVSYWTYDENFNTIKVCLIYNGFYTALVKLTSISETHYEAQGFSYYEPYYGTYSKKIRFNGDKCIITFHPLKPNNHGYYGSYLTYDIPLFNSKDAAYRYAQWLRDNIVLTELSFKN